MGRKESIKLCYSHWGRIVELGNDIGKLGTLVGLYDDDDDNDEQNFSYELDPWVK